MDIPHLHHALGILEHSHGRIVVSMQTLKKNNSIQYCPTNHCLHHALGDVYQEDKMLDRAKSAYKGMLLYVPEVSREIAFTALSHVACEEGDIGECRKRLIGAVSINQGKNQQSMDCTCWNGGSRGNH